MWETVVFFWGLLPQFAIPALPHPENHPGCLFIHPLPTLMLQNKVFLTCVPFSWGPEVRQVCNGTKTLVSLLMRWLLEFLYNRLKVKVKVAQSCLTPCNPMDYTVHGILQARILEWVAIPFSRGIFPTQGSNTGLPYCRRFFTSWATKEAILEKKENQQRLPP